MDVVSRVPWVSEKDRSALRLTAAFLVVLFGWLYVRTLHPGVGPYLDSIQYQITTLVMGVSHPPGYPTYTWLGALFVHGLPFGNPAYRLNLLSAVTSVVTVLLVQRITYHLTNSVTVGTLGALILGLAVRFWYQATYSELYPLYNTLVAGTWLALLRFAETGRRRFYLASVVLYAMAFGVNVPAIVLLPMWTWSVLSTDVKRLTRLRSLAGTMGIVLLIALQYLYVPLRAFSDPPPMFCNFCPHDWRGVIDFWLGKQWWGISFGLPLKYWLQRWADSGYQLMLQFWPIGVMLAGIGLFALVKTRIKAAVTCLLGLAGAWFFVVTYAVVDWDDFMTPVYLWFAPLIAVGGQAVWRWVRERLVRYSVPLATAIRGVTLAVVGLGLTMVMANNYPIADQSHKVTWHAWARDLLPQFEEGAWLLTPPTDTDGFVQTWVLRYISWAENLHPEMTVVYVADGSFDPPGPAPYYLTWAQAKDHLQEHPVYLIELRDPRVKDWVLQPLYRYDGWTIGYRVVGKRTATGVIPWVSADMWSRIKGDLIMP